MKECNAIEVKDVTKSFKVYLDRSNNIKDFVIHGNRRKFEHRKVLRGISFEVKKGEAIGLVGHNGCGKSTTLKLLTKIMYPDSGSIEMRGRVSSLIELGAGFHPDMSGRENIYINASIFGLSKKEIDDRVEAIIAFSELEQFIDNPVRTYSSGMYMRLAFAVAINVDADILLIDEILAVGDIAFQAKCFRKLKEIKKHGTTIVIVSHALGQIEEICEQSYWIHEGVVKMHGDPVEVHARYLDYMCVDEEDENSGEEDAVNEAPDAEDVERLRADMKEMKRIIGVMSNQLTELHWKEVDRKIETLEKDTDEISCGICGHVAARGSYATKESNCIFGGGHLVRYVCPECGAIFGPTKFTNLGATEIEDQYKMHYAGHTPSPSIEKEIRAFRMLNPDKKKVYLIYAYGSNMESVNILRKEGYQVYGYEPYVNEGNNPYVFKDKGELLKMRFDGICSDDLLEHFQNPIEELRFMKSLLFGKDSKMAHSTGCYEYVHEETRFHSFFFTGKSAELMAEKAGLKITERCDELAENDFMCCIFEHAEENDGTLDCMPMMATHDSANKTEEGIRLEHQQVAFGPYLTLRGGMYKLCYELEGDGNLETMLMRITAEAGNIHILESILTEKSGERLFNLDGLYHQLEFVFENQDNKPVVLKKLNLSIEK